MAIFLAPRPPNRRERLVARWRRWRWRKHGGISPRWRALGMVTSDVPPEFRGLSNDGIPAERWGGWNHTVTHVDSEPPP